MALSPESSGTHDLPRSPDVISRQKTNRSTAVDRDGRRSGRLKVASKLLSQMCTGQKEEDQAVCV